MVDPYSEKRIQSCAFRCLIFIVPMNFDPSVFPAHQFLNQLLPGYKLEGRGLSIGSHEIIPNIIPKARRQISIAAFFRHD